MMQAVTLRSPLSTDHLRFVPDNDNARRAFNEVAQTVTSELLSKEHHVSVHLQRHIYIEDSTPVAHSSTDPETESASSDPPLLYGGYFRLNIVRFAPNDLRKGELCGSMRLGGRKERPDLDVALTWRRGRDGVKEHHFHIVYNPTSLRMVLTPTRGREVVVNGKKYTYDQPYHIRDEVAGLKVGKLLYCMRYIASPSSSFPQHLAKLFKTVKEAARDGDIGVSMSEASDSFTSTASSAHYDLGSWCIAAPEARGTYGVVGSCFKNENRNEQSYSDRNYKVGHELAVKRVLRTSQNFESVKAEIDILIRFRGQRHLCFLVDAIFTSGTKDTLGPRPLADVWLILDPFARNGSLRHVLNDRDRGLASINRDKMIRWMWEGLLALRFIHLELQRPLIHRDIKPENLLVHTSNGVDYLVVSDFGHATFDTGSRDFQKGTRKYHPPEIRQLGDHSRLSIDYWTTAADIWSLGLVAAEMRGVKLPNGGLDAQSHEHILSEMPDDDKYCLMLSSMLSWLPKDMTEHPTKKGRPHVSQLLKHSIFIGHAGYCPEPS